MPKPNVREKLIEAGLQTLHMHGFNGCAVQDITDAAGAPKGSFYNHFSSKEDLALAALERFWDSGAERRALLKDASLDPVERLQQYFRLLSDAIVRNRFKKGCLIGNFSAEMSQSDEFRTRLAAIYSDWTDLIESCVQEAAQSGRVKPKVPASSVAAFLVNSWEGAILRSKVEKSRLPFDDFNLVVFASVFS